MESQLAKSTQWCLLFEFEIFTLPRFPLSLSLSRQKPLSHTCTIPMLREAIHAAVSVEAVPVADDLLCFILPGEGDHFVRFVQGLASLPRLPVVHWVFWLLSASGVRQEPAHVRDIGDRLVDQGACWFFLLFVLEECFSFFLLFVCMYFCLCSSSSSPSSSS